MACSTKCQALIITAAMLLLPFSDATMALADKLPTAHDINSLAETAKTITDAFFQDSFNLRIKYQCSEQYLSAEDKDNLHKLAGKAGDQLRQTEDNQRRLKSQIEAYTGDDWDNRYGQTGLWRKLSNDIYATILSKCQTDFYLALSSDQPQTDKILNDILTQINSLSLTALPHAFQLTKAKTLALLSHNDPRYKQQAQNQFDSLASRSDIDHPTALRAVIEKIKFGFDNPQKLDALTDRLNQCCPDDIELVLLLALAQRNLNRHHAFEKTLSLWPQTHDLLGSVLLADLSSRFTKGLLSEQKLPQTSSLEADLVALAAWKTHTQNYAPLLDYLSIQQRHQTPLTLYVTAIAFAKTNPTKTIDLLITASKLQQNQKSKFLDLHPRQIAAQAAQLAYNLFITDSIDPQLALHAFDNYTAIANANIDPRLEYLYTIILNDTGLTEKSTKLLEKIAARPHGPYRNRAALDLIKNKIKQKKYQTAKEREKLTRQLYDLIAASDSNDMYLEATTIYCSLLLEHPQTDSAPRVLNILTKTEIPLTPQLNALKSKAFQQLENLDHAARSLILAAEQNSCEYAPQAMELLSQIISQLDQLYDQNENLSKTASDFEKLAQFCCDCLDGDQKRQASFYLVEIIALSPEKNNTKLSAAEKLLDQLIKNLDADDPQILRCHARLLAKKQNFNDATQTWAKLADLHKAQTPKAKHPNAKWWRAKYYQLYCYSKSPQAEKKQLLHTIEVLENSFPDIPRFWAQKLNYLKQKTQN